MNARDKKEIRRHRNACERCCNFHDQLLQLAAVAPELDPPEEFHKGIEQETLWQMIARSAGGLGSEAEAPAELARTVNLFNLTDADMDSIFDGARWPTKQKSPKVVPLGKLDVSKADPPEDSHGRITDLAKFLFDSRDEELLARLVNYDHPNVRVERISEQVFGMLAKLQEIVGRHPYVIGSMVLSSDGTILSSRFEKPSIDCQDLGVWVQAAYHNAVAACKIIGHSKMMQLLSRTERGYVNIANLQGLMLVTLIGADEEAAIAVVNEIRALIP